MATTQRNLLEDIDIEKAYLRKVIVNKEKFLETLGEFNSLKDISELRNKVIGLKDVVTYPSRDRDGLLNIDSNGGTVSLRKDTLISELQQIVETQTLERARYYLSRLEKGI